MFGEAGVKYYNWDNDPHFEPGVVHIRNVPTLCNTRPGAGCEHKTFKSVWVMADITLKKKWETADLRSAFSAVNPSPFRLVKQMTTTITTMPQYDFDGFAAEGPALRKNDVFGVAMVYDNLPLQMNLLQNPMALTYATNPVPARMPLPEFTTQSTEPEQARLRRVTVQVTPERRPEARPEPRTTPPTRGSPAKRSSPVKRVGQRKSSKTNSPKNVVPSNQLQLGKSNFGSLQMNRQAKKSLPFIVPKPIIVEVPDLFPLPLGETMPAPADPNTPEPELSMMDVEYRANKARQARLLADQEAAIKTLSRESQDTIYRGRNFGARGSVTTVPPNLVQPLIIQQIPITAPTSVPASTSTGPVLAIDTEKRAEDDWRENNPDDPDIINDPLAIQLDSFTNEDLQDISRILPDMMDSTGNTIAESEHQGDAPQAGPSHQDQPQQEGEEAPGRRTGGARM